MTGRSDWLGEGRWERTALRGADFPALAEHLTGHDPRGSLTATSDGTWSTGRQLPTAALVNETLGLAIAWQIEHNGAWRWEIGEDTDGGYYSLSGPTDADHAWTAAARAGGELRDGAGDRGLRVRLGRRRQRADRLSARRAPPARRQHGDAGRVQRLHEHAQRRPDHRASCCR